MRQGSLKGWVPPPPVKKRPLGTTPACVNVRWPGRLALFVPTITRTCNSTSNWLITAQNFVSLPFSIVLPQVGNLPTATFMSYKSNLIQKCDICGVETG